ncbi:MULTISPECIES: peptidylprolyl isomerase [unclassified Coleofasciculus]|uniref:peptidylprolyl isomerase n=1 Tax=unclassified Coleofasciculus TaxID=2692782 RepID=UPI00187DFE9F|nr:MULTISPECIES: peptidylprolyl isomerase [unclassified Coleofasciculus]MBE9128073.1 peptidylprolyl isomerase [Coleofasciculus sp. LEGE 07081]MBE9149324.1 peptidylprolyl isomerase [Coleofasciculus sp. LEGE 07092]
MQVTIRRWLVLLVVVGGLVLGGCSTPQVASLDSTSPSNAETTASSVTEAANSQVSDLPRLEGKATVVLTVKGSPITIEVNGDDAPITAGNFVDLVERDFYDDLVFHRVVREPQPFVVQGGDPQGKDPNFPVERLGTGSFIDPETSQARYVPLEIKPEGAAEPVYSKTLEKEGVSAPPKLRHTRGAVAMARSSAPDSASSQFYISLAELPFLDGSYAVFGYVKDGMDVVDKIQVGDRIESAEVTQGLENLKKPSEE